MLGGGTRAGFLSDAILQLVSVPILLWSLVLVWGDQDLSGFARFAVWVCLALVAFAVLQVIPLPAHVWERIPSFAAGTATFAVLGQPPANVVISVAPSATILAVLSAIPPLAVFLGTLALSAERRSQLTLVLLCFATLSVFLGLTQLSQGPSSPLRFFEVTNPSDAVGFFANRNHYAALLYSALVFASVWVAYAIVGEVQSRTFRQRRVAYVTAGLTLVIALIASSAMARSRAGVALTVLALFASFWIVFGQRPAGSLRGPARLLGAAVAIALIMIMQAAIYRVLERFTDDPLQDARGTFTQTTLAAAKSFAPLGSGFGTFTRVYPTFERPDTALVDTYVNRAHNDLAEFALEGGVIAGVAMAAFGILLLLRTWILVVRPQADADRLHLALARAALVVLLLIALHSLVDYPLRTSAIAAIFALCAGLALSGIPAKVERERDEEQSLAEVFARSVAGRHPMPRKAWGNDVAWPDAWQGNRSKNEQDKT